MREIFVGDVYVENGQVGIVSMVGENNITFEHFFYYNSERFRIRTKEVDKETFFRSGALYKGNIKFFSLFKDSEIFSYQMSGKIKSSENFEGIWIYNTDNTQLMFEFENLVLINDKEVDKRFIDFSKFTKVKAS